MSFFAFPVALAPLQHSQTTSIAPSSHQDATAAQRAPQSKPLEDDPPKRTTGIESSIRNDEWYSEPGRSDVYAVLEKRCPDALEYYESRRTGQIEATPFQNQEPEEPVSTEVAKNLWDIEYCRVKHAFFPIDYTRGFTHRGRESTPFDRMQSLTYEIIVLREGLERSGLVGPWDEEFEEGVDPILDFGNDQVDGPLWKASDEKRESCFDALDYEEDVGRSEESKDDEDVGPLGESRDEEQIGRVGDRSDEDDNLHQEEGGEEDEGMDDNHEEQESLPAIGAEQKERLMLIAQRALAIHTETYADTRDVSSSQTANALRLGQRQQLAYSSNHVTSTPPTPSRKRTRSLDDVSKDGEDGTTKQTSKRSRSDMQPRKHYDVDEEYLAASWSGVAANGDMTLFHQPISAESEAASTPTEWMTAHGINSEGANICDPDRGVYDSTGQWTEFLLPTSRGLRDRPWTEEEKEDLRAYIQDYGVEDWALLSQSTSRPESDLRRMYLDIHTTRNRQAGRPERAGLSNDYPNLARPPRPRSPEPTESPMREESA